MDSVDEITEIGATSECDPLGLDTEWPWHCEWYGQSHLLGGLAEMKEAYDKPEWANLSDFADYGLFLGYSGRYVRPQRDTGADRSTDGPICAHSAGSPPRPPAQIALVIPEGRRGPARPDIQSHHRARG